MSRASSFTAEDDQTIGKLLQEGHTATVIGQMMGRTRNSVIGRIHRQRELSEIGFARGKHGSFSAKTDRAIAARKKSRAVAKAQPVQEAPKASVPKLRIKTFTGTPEQYDALAHKLPLGELGWQDCRFPIGDPKEAGFGFCGHAKAPGRTRYCDHHHRRVYQVRQPVEKAPA
jgi:GcrA cell cycle regulator